MLRHIIICMLIAFCPSIVMAQVSVTGVSGTVSNGQSITVSGSGFGDNGPTVVLFDDFEGGTNGAALETGLAEIGAWESITQPTMSTYSNANKVSGNNAARFDISAYQPAQLPSAVFRTASAFDSFFISYWTMLPSGNTYPGDGYGGSNWKIVWVTKDDDANDADICPGGNGWAWTHWFGNDSPISESTSWKDSGGVNDYTMVAGRWDRHAWWQKGATGETGATYVVITNSTQGTYTAGSKTNVITLNTGDTNKRQQFNVNGYVRETPNSYPTFDDIYIATGEYAQARVEICNSATYSSCTTFGIVTTTSWAGTSIAGVVRQGNLSPGTVYMFVTDANGTRNATGYAVTLGGQATSSASGVTITGSTLR